MKRAEHRWNFQDDIVQESIEDILVHKSKLGLFLAPGLGKTLTALKIIREYVDNGKRVGVSAFSRNEIKVHWVREIVEHAMFEPYEYQVVVNVRDANAFNDISNKIDTCLIQDVKKNKPLTLFIPQTVYNHDLGKFDLIVVDEVHQYLEVKDGILQGIIDASSKSETRLIGLTGTGHTLLAKGTFNQEDPDTGIIIRDVPFAIKGKRIMPVDIDLCFFDFALTTTCYNRDGEVNPKGKLVLKSNLAMSYKTKFVLNHVKGHSKILIICPPGTNTNTRLHDTLNAQQKGCCVIKSSYLSKTNNETAENEFRYNNNVKYMVVVAMAGIGWNFEKLDCVLDLTFTRNISLIIQRIARACRYHHGKKPRYVYCSDSSRAAYDAHLLIGEALALMREDGIRDYKNLKIFVDQAKVEKSKRSATRKEVISLGSIQRYFPDKPEVSINSVSTMQCLTLDRTRMKVGRKPAYHDDLHRFWRRMVKKRIIADFGKNKKLVKFLKELRQTVPEYSDLFQRRVAEFVKETYNKEYNLVGDY